MLLRNKTLLVIGVAFILVIAAASVLSEFVLMSHFSALERENTQHSLDQGLACLTNDADNLDKFNADWAKWDDTYQFVTDGNQAYIDSNLVDQTFIDAKISVMMFVDLTGRVVYDKAYDPTESKAIPVSKSLLDQLSPDSVLVKHKDVDSKTVGIVMLSEGPMIISSRPITTSDNQGPIRGASIMGEYLDETEVDELSQSAHLSITISLIDDPHPPSGFQSAWVMLARQDTVVMPLSQNRVAGYAMIRDIYDNPAIVMRVDTSRDVYNQGLASAITLIVALAVAGVGSGAASMLFINGQVLVPVSKLIRDVEKIGADGKAETRLKTPKGAHEFEILADTINTTLHALKLSEQKYRALFSSVPVGVYQSTPEGKLLTANPALVSMLGYTSEEELRATDIARELYVNAHDREMTLHNLASNGELRSVELRLKRKDGRELIVLDSSHAMCDEQGSVLLYEGTLTDITRRKQMEEELRDYSQHLEQLVEERTKKLEESKRMATIGEVAGMVGHDIRNPLTGIKTAVYYLKKVLAPKLGGKEMKMLGIIDKGAEQADRIVNDLLEYSRELRLKLVEGSAGSVVKEALAAVDMPTTIFVDNLARDDPAVMFDVDQMRRVCINLIRNAAEAMPQGGTLTIGSHESDGSLVINFTDTGTGMSEEVIGRMWTPLFTTKTKGMGFGLPICRRVVEAHGGTITVKSEVGKGTTFTLAVPIKPSPAQGV